MQSMNLHDSNLSMWRRKLVWQQRSDKWCKLNEVIKYNACRAHIKHIKEPLYCKQLFVTSVTSWIATPICKRPIRALRLLSPAHTVRLRRKLREAPQFPSNSCEGMTSSVNSEQSTKLKFSVDSILGNNESTQVSETRPQEPPCSGCVAALYRCCRDEPLLQLQLPLPYAHLHPALRPNSGAFYLF